MDVRHRQLAAEGRVHAVAHDLSEGQGGGGGEGGRGRRQRWVSGCSTPRAASPHQIDRPPGGPLTDLLAD